MKFGICCAPGSLGEPKRLMDVMQDAGADYLEWTVGTVMDDAEFEKLQGFVAEAPLKPEAFCVFVPPHHRLTGPSVNLGAALDYCGEAMKRCHQLGAEIVVLGSGGARKIPAGFDPAQAHKQFLEFGRELAPLAQNAGITVALEPLNSQEDNLVNSVKHGAQIVDEVGHPHFQLLADFYHMVEDDEPVSHIVEANGRIRHTHLADLGRFAPGYAEKGEADFLSFFGALRKIGYDARCSFEGKTHDLAAQAKPLLQLMRQRWEQSAD